jgi:hypothetical protein
MPARAADSEAGPEPELSSAEVARHTLIATPTGVETYTAFLGERGLGASGVANVTSVAGSETDLSGGFRLWGGFLDRVTAQGDAAKNSKGRFAPSLAVGVRVLGDRSKGWALGVLGRYRTEGFSTVDGEVEGGLLGSFARRQLHLDAGVIAGVGIEEEEADGEGLVRFGYDLSNNVRLGVEGRVRHELETGGEQAARAAGESEWDMFAGAQANLAFSHFFGVLTVGPQKPRASEDIGLMLSLMLGGVAF